MSLVRTHPLKAIRNALSRIKRTVDLNIDIAVSPEARAVVTNVADIARDEISIIEEALAALEAKAA